MKESLNRVPNGPRASRGALPTRFNDKIAKQGYLNLGALVVRQGEGYNLTAQFRRQADLPDYAMPQFDGIGTNEFIVTTAHGVCDFISAVDTPAIWELNVWYHTLNCGMTTRISGETDFPCIYGDLVGLGRIYVKLQDGQELNYQATEIHRKIQDEATMP